jgi:hypothetical protein
LLALQTVFHHPRRSVAYHACYLLLAPNCFVPGRGSMKNTG